MKTLNERRPDVAGERKSDDAKEVTEWADRCGYWQNAHDNATPIRKRRERRKAPLILCSHGLSIRVDKSTIRIRDGNTHYPSEERVWRLFKGDRDLPPRIVVVDGSGEITFDAIAWLSEQNVSLVWLKWDGATCGVMSATGYAADTDLVCWQRETANDPRAQLAFAKRLITDKLDASIQTLIACFPETRHRATAAIRQTRNELRKAAPDSVSDILGIEGKAAAAYFAAWDGLELQWTGLKRQPIPDEWKRYSSRSSLANGPKPRNRNASHPVNAMLNYGYAILQRQMQIEAIAEGYDPTIGIMHKPKKGSPAYALDLMEPLRPVVDRAILDFVQSETFSGKDFTIQGNGVCRLNPELARRVISVLEGLITN
jgi:CRISPR-associated protein Cas1